MPNGKSSAPVEGRKEQRLRVASHSPIPFIYMNGVSFVHLPEIIAVASRA
jgi:hypothetical protein